MHTSRMMRVIVSKLISMLHFKLGSVFFKESTTPSTEGKILYVIFALKLSSNLDFLYYRNLRQKIRLSTKLEFLFFALYGRNPALKVLKLLNTNRLVQKVVQLIFCFTVFWSWYGHLLGLWSSSAWHCII